MLRRSLILILAFLLLGLGLTAGYAVLNWRGSDALLAEATAKFERGDAAETVRVIDLCEPGAGVRENEPLLQKLWDLRLRANTALGNTRRVLEDIERLLHADPGRIDLQLQRIYFLSVSGSAEEARQLALAFVEAHPDHARGRELAGEACQAAYGERLRDLNKRLRSELGYDREREGINAFLEFVYRPDGDLGGVAALQRLEDLYTQEPRFRTAWPQLKDDLRALRERVQQTLGLYQKALEMAQAMKPRNDFFAAAYRGTSFALRQAGRPDDVVAQAEIYLSNYDHRFCTEAAIDGVNAHLRDGLWEAAVDLADRFLPLQSWEARFRAGKLDGTVEQLLLAKAYALYRLGRDKDLDELARTAAAMGGAGLAVGGVPPAAGSFAGLLRQRAQVVEPQLAAVCNWLLQLPPPQDGQDLLEVLMPPRLEQARTGNTAPAELVEIASTWVLKRPGAIEPLLARASMQLATGQAAAAMATASEVLAAAPRHEGALHLLGAAADRAYRDSSQDGESLLIQCVQRNTSKPEYPPHPVCLLNTGEIALKQQRHDIARACARAAADSFPWSQWPRLLEARAELAGGKTAAAVDVLARAIDVAPTDSEAIAMWFDTCTRAGLPVARFLPLVVRTLDDDAAIAAALLRAAIAENSPATAALARAAVARTEPPPDLLALAAQAMSRSGDVAGARAVLQRSRAATQKTPNAAAQALQATAAIEWIGAAAATNADDALAALAQQELAASPPAGPVAGAALVATARQLVTAERPRTAYLLAVQALALGDAIELRDAANFVFAGECAERLHEFDAAAAHYTAALSFGGGEAAAQPLARLELQRSSRERANMAMAMLQKPTDAALALLAGHPAAAEVAQARLHEDRSDLLAAVPFALAGQADDQTFGAELRTITPALRTAVLELVAMLADPELAAPALERARALQPKLPQSRAVALLLARALVQADLAADAQAIHQQLFEAGARDLPLYGEAVRATAAKGYTMPAPIRAELRLRAAATADPLPPPVLAHTLRDVAEDSARNGNLGQAVQVLTTLVTLLPEASKASMADVEMLLLSGQTPAAAALLERLRTIGSMDDRRRAGAALYRGAAQRNASLTPGYAAALTTAALADLDRGELAGPAFAFVLADETRLAALAPAVVAHHVATLLDATACGKDGRDVLPAAVGYARRRLGDAATLALLDAAIQAHPAAIDFWLQRAAVMADMRDGHRGVDDARRALAYADDPAATVEFSVLAGELRALQPADLERLEAVPPALRDTPRARYARGLAALRSGHPDRAEDLLVESPPQPTGFHLYARALANLMRTTPEARTRALQLLQQLGTDYANSSLARNAGSFARQLSPN